VFRPDYPGNATARGVVEAPNGDPAHRDTGKRYSHVALKYLPMVDEEWTPEQYYLASMLSLAHSKALKVAVDLGVPPSFTPLFGFGALRVLEYPAGVGASAVHTDMALFTLNLYRSVPNPGLGALGSVHMGELGELIGLGTADPHHVTALAERQCSLVYFAMPDHAAVLPSGETVGEWVRRETSRRRYTTTPTTETTPK
jgi:hypothetical protein